MVYAVCSSVYASFRAALGRDPVWGFERDEDDDGIGRGALILRPRAFPGRNAYYSKVEGALNFGYFTAEATAGGFMQGEEIFTCLSHDVVAHEVTHALLDGLRSHFTIPTQPWTCSPSTRRSRISSPSSSTSATGRWSWRPSRSRAAR